MESVIADQHDRGILPCQFQQGSQHHVMVAVSHFDHMLIVLEILFAYPRQAGGVILHESMAEMVDRVIVDRHEVPGLELHRRRRGGVDRRALAEHLRHGLGSTILLLIDFGQFWEERENCIRGELLGMHP